MLLVETPFRFAVVFALVLALAACGANERSDNAGLRCGNGRLDPGEICDGSVDLAAVSCESFGGATGTVRCGSDCTYDLSGCDAICGNGRIDPLGTPFCEQCDGADLGGKRCEDFGGTGRLRCGDFCTLDTSACNAVCGNGEIEENEECDGAVPEGMTCESLGYRGGLLGCDDRCRLQFGSCDGEPVCGNGRREREEECDGENLAFDCQSQRYSGGQESCSALCAIDSSGCTPPSCGNGIAERGEDCDGDDPGLRSCEDLGFGRGILSCGPDCAYDTTGCAEPVCGNGVLEGDEECDGGHFGVLASDCRSLGYRGGRLSCRPDCTRDVTACTQPSCGNGIAEPDEECDGEDLRFLRVCRELGYIGGILACGPTCELDVSECFPLPVCGNGKVEHLEDCDGDTGGRECTDVGFAGGTLVCSASCALDASACTPPPATCGNGRLDPEEECDGASVGDASCADLGRNPGLGKVRCTSSCRIDRLSCAGLLTCGNGRVDGEELCEGVGFAGASCTTRGFAGGSLRCFGCEAISDFDCIPLGCGDGVVGPGEECDPAGPLPNTCEAYGFAPSSFADVPCDPTCRLSTGLCGDPLSCGNGVIDAGEVCDGGEFGDDSCEQRGLGPGRLVCFGCTFVSDSSCERPSSCGDGNLDPGEQCDGADLGGEDCDRRFPTGGGGTLTCRADCTFDTTGCFQICAGSATQSRGLP